MTDPTEQTARIEFRQRCTKCGYTNVSTDPNAEQCSAQFAGGYVCDGEFDDNGPIICWWDLCAGLGLPTDTLPSRLVADLAIAARARACASDERFDNVDGPDGRTFYTPERLLAYLLNGEQP